MTENAQAKQQSEPGQPHEPATNPKQEELSDEQLDQAAGGYPTIATNSGYEGSVIVESV